jgi:hypothetical protein
MNVHKVPIAAAHQPACLMPRIVFCHLWITRIQHPKRCVLVVELHAICTSNSGAAEWAVYEYVQEPSAVVWIDDQPFTPLQTCSALYGTATNGGLELELEWTDAADNTMHNKSRAQEITFNSCGHMHTIELKPCDAGVLNPYAVCTSHQYRIFCLPNCLPTSRADNTNTKMLRTAMHIEQNTWASQSQLRRSTPGRPSPGQASCWECENLRHTRELPQWGY